MWVAGGNVWVLIGKHSTRGANSILWYPEGRFRANDSQARCKLPVLLISDTKSFSKVTIGGGILTYIIAWVIIPDKI